LQGALHPRFPCFHFTLTQTFQIILPDYLFKKMYQNYELDQFNHTSILKGRFQKGIVNFTPSTVGKFKVTQVV